MASAIRCRSGVTLEEFRTLKPPTSTISISLRVTLPLVIAYGKWTCFGELLVVSLRKYSANQQSKGTSATEYSDSADWWNKLSQNCSLSSVRHSRPMLRV